MRTSPSRFGIIIVPLVFCLTACPVVEQKPYEFTIGEIAAEFTAGASTVLAADALAESLDVATVISSEEALELLSTWPKEATLDRARAMLTSESNVAIAVSDRYLHITPTIAAPRDLAISVDLGSKPDTPRRCLHFHEFGHREGNRQACHCITTIQTGACPVTNTGNCTQCPAGDETWSPERPWIDPIPQNYQRVRELFGEDPRFECTVKASVLRPGNKLFEPCVPGVI